MADYTHTIDRWDEATGESLIERIAGVSAYLVALETYRVAVKLAHEKNSSMSLLTIWKLAPTATHTPIRSWHHCSVLKARFLMALCPIFLQQSRPLALGRAILHGLSSKHRTG
jgi:hypothetical protein